MPVPGFNEQGILPPIIGSDPTTADRSPYYVSMPDFVRAFATNEHRRVLVRNLLSYRELIAQDGYVSGLQFLDGSFVENVEITRGRPPQDIDVFTMLNAPQKYLSDFSLWEARGSHFWASAVANNILNKQRFSLDTYALLIEEQEFGDNIKNVMYWYSLFSHQRETFAWKGFVAVDFNRDQDAEALALLGAT